MRNENVTRKQRSEFIERADRSCLTGSQKVILRVLLFKYYNVKTGACFPSDEKIATAASVSTKTVRRARVALIEGGWIEVVERHADRRRRNYRFPRLDEIAPISPATSQVRKLSPKIQSNNRTNWLEKPDILSVAYKEDKTNSFNHQQKVPPNRTFVGRGSREERQFNQILANEGLPVLDHILEQSEFENRSGFWVKPDRVPSKGTVEYSLAVDWFKNEYQPDLSK